MDRPAFAVVGLGGFAQTHLRYMRQAVESGAARHVAQVIIDEDRRQFPDEVQALEAAGVEVFPSLRQLLADARGRVDAVGIPTGIPLHRPMCQAVLEAGCHALLEKPVAGSIQDVDALLAAEARAGRRVGVGFQHIYRNDVQRLKDEICQGRFGAVQSLRARVLWPRPPAYYGRNGWAGRLAVGDTWVLDGPHHNAMAHAINLMCFLASRDPGRTVTPRRVQAEMYRANPIEGPDCVAMRVEAEEGPELFFVMAHCTDQNHDPVFYIETEKAAIEVAYLGGVRIHWRTGKSETHEWAGATGVFEDLAAVISGRRSELLCPLRLARAQTLVTCATFESTEVHPLPEEMVRQQPEDGLLYVPAMADAVEQALEQRSLWSEMGYDWARPGRVVDLQGYDYFPQQS